MFSDRPPGDPSSFWLLGQFGGWRTRTAILLVLLLAQVRGATAQPVVTAYVFAKDSLIAPAQIDARKLTRVNYAFANIAKGRMVEGYASDEANFATLNSLKLENPGLTVLVSVGGWLWSGGFSDMALTPASRAIFIDSVADFVVRYKLDGLDIDWEYPGMAGAGNPFRSEDKQNYTLLLKELRERFDKVEKQIHRRLYITIATGASTEFLEHTDMRTVQKLVDTVNLMSYDYYEPGVDKITGNHAPLFVDPSDPKAVSADQSVRDFEQAGVPASKLVLGVPFYGHVWGQVPPLNHGLFQAGAPVPNAFANYASIATTMLGQGYSRYWNEKASVPYLYNAEKRIFVSYEDAESLSVKCKYVLDHHLAGVMFWDYTSDPSGALLGAIHSALRPSAKDAQK
ncbi:Chitinase [Acidisarcina polymorpha]|uniref:chitinase n=1 Tax=Acidisarcina polymorpha TaxID=2211140 RepID=A0A2Z5G383_9BACT|nr:glycoside hydrolase family 18 protein [Acidisarcina polymorpha]AXC13127.1 Chitinase [Acidisarcina polymorpha]